MNKKTTGIISYITWFGWLAAFLAGDRENAKLHLNQSLILNLTVTIVPVLCFPISYIMGLIPVLGGIFKILINLTVSTVFILYIICIIAGILAAYKEKDTALPLIGSMQLLK